MLITYIVCTFTNETTIANNKQIDNEAHDMSMIYILIIYIDNIKKNSGPYFEFE